MATLKSLVDETTNIKDELKACHSNLKNNLIAKGVECSDTDKISALVDKVNAIETNETTIVSETCLLSPIVGMITGCTTTLAEKSPIFSYTCLFSGQAVVEYQVYTPTNDYGNYYTQLVVIDKKGNEKFKTEEILLAENKKTVTFTTQYDNFKSQDVIQIYHWRTGGSGSNASAGNIKIMGEVRNVI